MVIALVIRQRRARGCIQPAMPTNRIGARVALLCLELGGKAVADVVVHAIIGWCVSRGWRRLWLVLIGWRHDRINTLHWIWFIDLICIYKLTLCFLLLRAGFMFFSPYRGYDHTTWWNHIDIRVIAGVISKLVDLVALASLDEGIEILLFKQLEIS